MNSNKFSSFLQYCLGKIQHQSLGFDLIQEVGRVGSDTERENIKWITVGVETLNSLLYTGLNIKELLTEINFYDDTSEQFMYDLHALLGEFAYHASFYSIYFYSLENIIFRRPSKVENSLVVHDATLELDTLLSGIFKTENKMRILKNIYKNVTIICHHLDVIESDFDSMSEDFMGKILTEIQCSSLKLHSLFFEFSETGE